MRALLALLLVAGLAPGGTRHVRILHTNDIHGALLPSEAWWMSRDFPPPLGNAASALTLIRAERDRALARGNGFLLLDAGDFWKGSPISDRSHGMAAVDWFNRAGYDAVGVGSFDYSEGMGRLRELAHAGRMPWVNANIRVKATDATPDFLVPHVILDAGGVKVGIVGLITSYQNEVIRDSAEGEFAVANERDVARAEVARLREAGADIVVGLTHIGNRYEVRLAEDVPGFDVIVGGRSNSALREAVETPKHHTIVVQAASRLTAVGVLDLAIDTDTRTITGYTWELVNLFPDQFPPDPDYARYLDSLRTLAEAGFDDVIGRAGEDIARGDPMRESPAGNFVADAMREYCRADIAFQNIEGISRDVTEGDITYRDCYELDGHDNTLVAGSYTGRQVREMLEAAVGGRWSVWQVSGVRLEYDPAQAMGMRVKSVTVAGEPLAPDRVYRVATNSWIGGEEGQYRVFRDGEEVEDTGVPVRDAIAAWVRAHSPVRSRAEGRLARVSGR